MSIDVQTYPGPLRGQALMTLTAKYGLVLMLLTTIAVYSWLAPSFSSSANLRTISYTSSISAIMFLGATWVIACGEIDLSFMSVAALSNMLVAGLVLRGVDWGTAACIGVAVGAFAGLVNGALVAYLGLPSLITTIATGGLFQSFAAAIGHGASIGINDTGFLGTFLKAGIGVVPAGTLLTLTLYVLAWFAQERLLFGHYLYAMQQNRRAAVEAGIPVRRILVVLFIISSATAALAGVLLTADLSSGQPRIGLSYFLDGLTAILLGGMVVRMAQPNVLGTLVGVLLLAVLVSGTALLGWPDWQRLIMKGALLILGAVIVVRSRSAPAIGSASGPA